MDECGKHFTKGNMPDVKNNMLWYQLYVKHNQKAEFTEIEGIWYPEVGAGEHEEILVKTVSNIRTTN